MHRTVVRRVGHQVGLVPLGMTSVCSHVFPLRNLEALMDNLVQNGREQLKAERGLDEDEVPEDPDRERG